MGLGTMDPNTANPGAMDPGAMDPGVGPAGAPNELRLLAATLRRGWRWLFAGLAGGIGLMVVALWVVTPQHTAVMIVGPTARVGTAAMGARVPVVTGRESALAVAEPGAGDESLSDYARYLELFGSGPVADRLEHDPAVLRALFPARWDAERERWRPAPGMAAALRRSLLALVGREDWVEPDGERVAQALRERLVVEMLRSGPMRRIALRHPDRAVALDLLGRIAAATDAHLRAEAARRGAAQIAHIRARLAAVTVAEHRQALSELLSDQERVAMMIGVDLPFAADMIQPPTAASLPDWPNPAALVPLGGIAGLVAALFALSVRHAWVGGDGVGGAGVGGNGVGGARAGARAGTRTVEVSA